MCSFPTLRREFTTRGELRLRVGVEAGRSTPRSQFHRGALSTMRPLYLEDSGQVTVFILNPGGGYVSGDVYDLSVEVEEGAELLLTTQSATKVYRTTGLPARQTMSVRVADRGVMEYLPDQLIVYRDGCYEQLGDFELSPTAHLLVGEVITPGWSPTSEPFEYEEIRLRSSVWVCDESGERRPLLVDFLRICPPESVTGIGVLEGHSHCGQLLIIDRRLDEAFMDEVLALAEKCPAEVGVTLTGAEFTCADGGPAPRCLVVRSLGRGTGEIDALHRAIANTARTRFFERPIINLRKY